MSEESKVYLLSAGRFINQGTNRSMGVVVLPEPTAYEDVEAAWSYAVRYSAKGLDVPDWDAVFELLLERHPDWRVLPPPFVKPVVYNPENVEGD